MYWLPAILILPYIFLLLQIYRNLLKISAFRISSPPSVHVTVIIACRNEKERLPGIIESITRQDYPRELFEVIIVDDNSTDNTFDTADAKNLPPVFRLMHNEGRGKKEAIRTGINAASNRLIITTDADCSMGENWIKTIASFFETNQADLIICPVQLAGTSGFFGRFQELEFLSLQGITAGTAMAGTAIMCNGANLAFTRESYLKQADNMHFELDTGDDVFLLHGIKNEPGSRIMWLESTDSLVSAAASPSVCSFLRQRKRWISKWNSYNDSSTILAGILTLAAIMLQLISFTAIFFNAAFIPVFLLLLILKSFPDYLILKNTTARYGKKHLMRWFLPAQLVYPFYVMGVLLYTLIPSAGSGD